MAQYVVGRIMKLMIARGMQPQGARVLVLGLTFKENCPDVRNTKVVDVVEELRSYGAKVDVHDPWVDAAEAAHEYGIEMLADPQEGDYDVMVMAVAHKQFRDAGVAGVRRYGKENAVLFDIKYVFPSDDVDGRL